MSGNRNLNQAAINKEYLFSYIVFAIIKMEFKLKL